MMKTTNGMVFQRQSSFAPPKNVPDVPKLTRSQSVNMSLEITMSVDSLYNHAVKYHRVEMRLDLAECAFKAALSRSPDHVQSLIGYGTLLREMGRMDEGTELLHKATGIIMCPVMLPGEDKIRKIAETRNTNPSRSLPPPKDSNNTENSPPNKVERGRPPLAKPIRMGSMKAILAMNDVMSDVTNKRTSTRT